ASRGIAEDRSASRPSVLGASAFAARRVLTQGVQVHFGAAGHDANQLPALGARAGRALDDLDRVALVGLVVLVVHVAHRLAADVLAVDRVLHQAIDLDTPRLG